MQAAKIQDHLRDRMFEITPEEFEVLCKMVLVRQLDTKSLQVTAFQQDEGIDIEGVINEGIQCVIETATGGLLRRNLGEKISEYIWL